MDTSGPVDKLDLLDVRNQLALQITAGFNQVNTRLDTVNGRTRKVEIVTAQHSWALSVLAAVALALLGGMVTILAKFIAP